MLARHAKAQNDAPSDAARELSARGHADAAAMGRWLSDSGQNFDTVLCSSSARTRQTWRDIEAAGVTAGEVTIDERIYGAGVDELLDVLGQLPDAVKSVLVVGHAPTIPELTEALADREASDPDALAALRSNFPTACLAVLTIEEAWGSLTHGSANLTEVTAPRG